MTTSGTASTSTESVSDDQIDEAPVSLAVAPCRDRHRPQRAVQRYVDHEGQPRHVCGLDHLLVDGVPSEFTAASRRMREHLEAVVGEDRLVGTDTREDRLGPAREAGELVRLDEPESDDEIGLSDQPVDVLNS